MKQVVLIGVVVTILILCILAYILSKREKYIFIKPIEVDIYSSPDATPVVNTVWPQIIQYMKATIPQIEPFLHHPSADKWVVQKMLADIFTKSTDPLFIIIKITSPELPNLMGFEFGTAEEISSSGALMTALTSIPFSIRVNSASAFAFA